MKEKVLLSQPSTDKGASFKLPQGNKHSLQIMLLFPSSPCYWEREAGRLSGQPIHHLLLVWPLYLSCIAGLCKTALQNYFFSTVLIKCIKWSNCLSWLTVINAWCSGTLDQHEDKQNKEQQWPLEFKRIQVGLHLCAITGAKQVWFFIITNSVISGVKLWLVSSSS